MKKYQDILYKTLQLKRKIPIDTPIEVRTNIETIDLSFYDIGEYIKIGNKYYQVIKAKI